VGHRKHSRHLASCNVRQPAVKLVGNDSLQGYMPSVDDDVQRRVRAERVSVQTGGPEDRAVSSQTNRIVEAGKRQHLNVVDHSLDAFELAHSPLGILARDGLQGLSVKRQSFALEFELKVVENAVKRQRD